jgi:protein-tyrosine phosphatase
MIRVLFVCLGNICRSPMAEAIFMHLVRDAGLDDRIEADSAGTADWEIDAPPHPGTMRVLEQQGIRYSGHGRNLHPDDLDRFDYIITMDDQNTRDVKRVGSGSATVAPLLGFVSGSPIREVPDPYFDNRFDRTHDLVRAGAEALLEHIRVVHRL